MFIFVTSVGQRDILVPERNRTYDLNCYENVTPAGEGGGGLEYKKRWGCSSRILQLTPKGDQSGRGSRIF